jgi:spore coat protein JB
MLFDTDGFYLAEKKYKDDYDFKVSILNEPCSRLKIYDLSEAFKKGNLFPSLYDEYKCYKPELPKCRTEREKALLELQMLAFSIGDLNLYLDLHPNDAYAYQIFKEYVKEFKKKKECFTKVYGPLTLGSLTDDYEWSYSPWPWEEERL